MRDTLIAISTGGRVSRGRLNTLSGPFILVMRSRLGRNVSANLVGGVWSGALIVAATPLFLSRLSYEGYGLLSFWLMVQVVIGFLDLGLGATLVREFAFDRDQVAAPVLRWDLLRTLEWIYWPVAAIIGLALLLASHWISTEWLQFRVLREATVTASLQWMSIALALQFPSALYSSGLAGLQRQTRMNAIQMFANGLRYIGGVLVLSWRPDPVLFFAWQAVVAGAQTALCRAALRAVLEPIRGRRPRFDRLALERIWRFSAGMALTMAVSVLLANADRVFISRYLPAEELGKYALAFTATGVLQMGIQPFYRAYFPRFSELVALGDETLLRREYYRGCRTMAAIIIPAAAIGAAFAPQLFSVWVGAYDRTTVSAFRWLLLGIASSGVMWLPAAYQQAHGWTRLHVAMITGALVVGVPALYWTTARWGTAGAAVVWILHGLSDITLGLALMHRRLLRGEAWHWYLTVLVRPLLASLAVVTVASLVMPAARGTWTILCILGAAGASAVFLALANVISLAGHGKRVASES